MSHPTHFGLVSLAVVAILSSLAFSAPSLQKITTEYVLSDFSPDSKPAWWLTSLAPRVGASKFENGVLFCDFSERPGYIGISGGAPFITGDPEAVTLTFVSDGSGHPIVLRMMDSGWQFFQREIAVMDTPGPQTVTVPLADMPSWYHFGGPADGVVRHPVKPGEIIVDRDGPNASVKMVEIRAKTNVTIEQGFDLQLVSREQDPISDELTMQFVNILPWDASGQYLWKVTDLHGAVLDSGEDSIELSAGIRKERTLKVRREGIRLCEFTLNVRIPMHEIEGKQPKPLREGTAGDSALLSLTVPVAKSLSTSVVSDRVPPRPGTILPDSHFGMGIYLGQRYPIPEMERPAQMARDIGIKWSREEFSWARLEPEPGKWQWEASDAAVETLYRNGISVCGLLCYWSPWTKPYTEEGIRDYCNYVRAVVGRYKDRVKHWEIWNEPNIFFWGGTVEQHADLLKAAYDAVKEADPEAKVVACSTSGTDLKFIERLFQLGCFDKMDIVSIHPYRAPASPEKTDFIGEMMRADALVRKYGKPKDIWITEIGWPTNIGPNGCTEHEQAAILVRCYIQAIASGVIQKTFWYDYRNDGTDPLYHEHNFGIVRRDLIPKPAYVAFGVMTRHLEGKRYVKDMSTDKNVYAYLFDGGGGRCLAVWSTSGERRLTICDQSSAVVISDLAGKRRVSRPKEGRVEIVLSEYPQFVTRVNDSVNIQSVTEMRDGSPTRHYPIVSVLPMDERTIAVEVSRGQSDQRHRVSVRIPGFADVFDIEPGNPDPRTERYRLPDGVVLGSQSALPVTVIYDSPSLTMTRESNVYYLPSYRRVGRTTIDGSLDEWRRKPTLTLDESRHIQELPGRIWSGPDDLSAEVWVEWDEENLYLAARVRDDVFHQEHVEGETWRGDSIQFALDPMHLEASGLGDIYEILLAHTRDGPRVFSWSAPNHQPTGIITDADLAVLRETGFTTYEVSIPLSSIPPLTPSPGRTIGFSIIVNDNDGEGRKGWAQWTDGIGWHKNPSLYGDLTFVD